MAEVGDAVGNEGEDAAGAEGVIGFDGVQRVCQGLLIALAGGAGERGRSKECEYGAKAEEEAVDGLRWRDVVSDVKLDVGQASGRWRGEGHPLGQEGQRVQCAQGASGGQADGAYFQQAPPTEFPFFRFSHDLLRGNGLPGMVVHDVSFADGLRRASSTMKDCNLSQKPGVSTWALFSPRARQATQGCAK